MSDGAEPEVPVEPPAVEVPPTDRPVAHYQYVDWTEYDQTGRVLASGHSITQAFEARLQRRPGTYLVGFEADPNAHFVDVAELSVKTKSDMVLTQSGSIISGVPAGATVEVDGDGQLIEVSDGTVEWSFDLPGTHILRFRHPHHYDADVEVTQL